MLCRIAEHAGGLCVSCERASKAPSTHEARHPGASTRIYSVKNQEMARRGAAAQRARAIIPAAIAIASVVAAVVSAMGAIVVAAIAPPSIMGAAMVVIVAVCPRTVPARHSSAAQSSSFQLPERAIPAAPARGACAHQSAGEAAASGDAFQPKVI